MNSNLQPITELNKVCIGDLWEDREDRNYDCLANWHNVTKDTIDNLNLNFNYYRLINPKLDNEGEHYRQEFRKNMIATKASHKSGDISRDFDAKCLAENLCYVYNDDSDDDGKFWVGNWWTGYGFFDVKFPKNSTRELTAKEVSKSESITLTLN